MNEEIPNISDSQTSDAVESEKTTGSKKSGRAKKIMIGMVVFFAVAQLIPINRTNPPVIQDVQAAEPVQAILKRSCYDCHSNEAKWPWYGYVAPVSWLIAYDIHEGREHLNFSDWTQDEAAAKKARQKCWQLVDEGEMPMTAYVMMHPETELSESDKATLKAWAEAGTDLETKRQSKEPPK